MTLPPDDSVTSRPAAFQLTESAMLFDAMSLDEFGPGSANPYLALRLDGADPGIAAWLRRLPCPVIGIGEGALAPVCDVVLPDETAMAGIARNILAAPIAAMVLVQHLRASESLPAEHALTAESFAYATVQTGPEFSAWRQSEPKLPPLRVENSAPLVVSREDAVLRLMLNRASSRNAIGVELRDALCEAFDLARLDDSVGKIVLKAAGACFSVGGAVEEFGQIGDSATAHWIRSLRLPARRLIPLRERLEIRVNGAAIGAGAEIAAFAGRVIATKNAWFQLPELKYGLIPGAGGTVSLPRRIGRQKTAYMALSMRRVPAATALAWGLVDAIED